jgi:hypothetical protein
MKYEASNEFYECFLGKDGDINLFGKILLYPLLISCYFVWLSLDFLFVKNE